MASVLFWYIILLNRGGLDHGVWFLCNNEVRERHINQLQVRNSLMMTSSDGTIFRVTDPLWGESTGHRWIPLTKASDEELWCFLLCPPEKNHWANWCAYDLRRHGVHDDVMTRVLNIGYRMKQITAWNLQYHEICTWFCCSLFCLLYHQPTANLYKRNYSSKQIGKINIWYGWESFNFSWRDRSFLKHDSKNNGQINVNWHWIIQKVLNKIW